MHHPLPLPAPDEDEDEGPESFDTSDVTKERTRDVQIEALHARITSLEERIENDIRAMRIETREAAYEAKCARETGDLILDEVRKVVKFQLEERAERFALGDRVSNLEQPRQARRKK
jgi:chaperonin cofactor prefoldin